MSYRSVEEIKDDYHLHTVVYKQSKKAYNEAEAVHEGKRNRFYGIYLVLFVLSVVVVGFASGSFEVVVGYSLGGSIVSLFLTAHIFVEIFTHNSEPQTSDYGCVSLDRDRYVHEIKQELVESVIQGRIMKINYDKSNFYTWNMIVALDEDNKSHEYYADFYLNEEANTISVDAREFVVKR